MDDSQGYSAKGNEIMSNKKSKFNTYETPIDFDSQFYEWPSQWIVVKGDLRIGKEMVNLFTPFIQSLIDDGLAVKTIKRHMLNLCLLGSEIVRRINDEDVAFRKLPTTRIIFKYVDEESGPLLHFWNPNDPTEETYLKAFDATCRKLYKYHYSTK